MATTTALLAPADIDAFWRDGFVLRRDVFTGEQLHALRLDVDQLSGYADAVANGGGDVIGQQAWLHSEPDKYFTPVERLEEKSILWREVCEGTLKEHATQILGEPATLETALGIVKPPVKGQTFPLHQDGVYYGPDNGRYVIAQVYLDDVTRENGSILFAPGSHTQLWPHDTSRGKKSLVDPQQFQALVMPPGQAGDVVYFHLWLVHGSPPNTSPYCRRTVRVGYQP